MESFSGSRISLVLVVVVVVVVEKAVAEVAEKVVGSENTVECRAGC